MIEVLMAMVYGNCNAVCRLKGNGNGNAVPYSGKFSKVQIF